MQKITFTALLALATLTAFSQLKIDGEFRTRGIVNHGYKVPVLENSTPTFSVDQRSRVRLNYSTEKYSTRFTIQDARVWGSDDMYNKTGTEGNSYSLGIHEAWVNLNLGDKNNLKIGRQEWNYNDMRILSSKNWWTSGMSYDAFLLQRKNDEIGLDIDLGISYNNNGNVIGLVNNSDWDESKIKSMSFLNIRKELGEKTSVAIMLTASTKEDTSNRAQLATGTHGVIFNYNNKHNITDGFFTNASAYFQHGTDLNRGSNGSYKNINAYLIAAEIGFRTLDKKLELGGGIELISGHDYSSNDTDYNNTRHSFDLLYGARFPYYGGNMNYFLVQDSYLVGTKGGGFSNPYIKAKYKINKKSMITAGIHFPTLTTNVKAHTGINNSTNKPSGSETDTNGNQVYWKGSLGNNIDIGFTHKFNKEIILKAGASYAFVSDIKNQMTNGYDNAQTKELHSLGNNYFGWVMLTIKPTFFNANK